MLHRGCFGVWRKVDARPAHGDDTIRAYVAHLQHQFHPHKQRMANQGTPSAPGGPVPAGEDAAKLKWRSHELTGKTREVTAPGSRR